MDDVMGVVRNIQGYLVAIALIIVIFVVAIVAARRYERPRRSLVRKSSALAAVLAIALVVNLVLTGPMSALISAATAPVKAVSSETKTASRGLIEDIADEGIVLLKNDENSLPLEPGNINLFGWSSVNPLYGGGGSGSIDASEAVSIVGALENAGFTVNQDLVDFYASYQLDGEPASRGRVGSPAQEWTLPEPPLDTYGTLMDEAKSFSDTAVLVISRTGGEGADLPTDMGAVIDGSWNTGIMYKNGTMKQNSEAYNEFEVGEHFLEPSRTEEDLIDKVCANFNSVVLVYNGSNAFEFEWTEKYPQIKSILLAPCPGVTGFTSLGSILAGVVNPSGRTATTFARDLTRAPYFNNIGEFAYSGRLDLVDYLTKANGEARIQGVGSFLDYNDGIYVGYRFYETAADEGLIDYASEVMYPFGYGLSYTSFEQEMGTLSVVDGTMSVDVTVTNTGSVAGKDVVQLYSNPPYTNGGIEKASANLVAFDKTGLIAPGESQTLTLSWNLEDLASYDMGAENGTGAYVLEAGDYEISLKANSHDIISSEPYTLGETITYGVDNPRSTDGIAATNRFGFAEGTHTVLSRADHFANYDEAVAGPAPEEYERSLDDLKPYFNADYDELALDDAADEMPAMGAKNGLVLNDLRGVGYDDERWEKLLDQLTFDEMVKLVEFGGYQTVALDSIGKVATVDIDGTSGLNNFVAGQMGTGFAGEIMVAQTWNADLARAMGEAVGNESVEMGVSGWYAPTVNTTRSAFSGRDFEYYGEDGLMSGLLGAAVVDGAQDKGLYCYTKHFVANDQEINRHSCFEWIDEQTLREIYMRPFELVVKNTTDGPQAVMSSYNYLGTTWTAGCSELLNDVLRSEWGFEGMVITDYFNEFYMDADYAIRGGNDLMLSSTGGVHAHVTDDSATSVQALRQASKNILFTVANSNAYENYESAGLPTWQVTLFAVDAVVAAAVIGFGALFWKRYKKDLTVTAA